MARNQGACRCTWGWDHTKRLRCGRQQGRAVGRVDIGLWRGQRGELKRQMGGVLAEGALLWLWLKGSALRERCQ